MENVDEIGEYTCELLRNLNVFTNYCNLPYILTLNVSPDIIVTDSMPLFYVTDLNQKLENLDQIRELTRDADRPTMRLVRKTK